MLSGIATCRVIVPHSEMTQERLRVLGDSAVLLTSEQDEAIFDAIELMFPIKSWGGVKWDFVSRKVKVNNPKEIITVLHPSVHW